MKNKKNIFITLGLLAVAAFVFVGWRARQARAAANADAQTGEIVTAFIGDLARTASASGKVQPRQEATLSLELPGVVTAVPIRVGDTVQASDLLVQIDADELALAVTTAEQSLIIQQARLAQLQADATPEEIAAAEAAVASAQAQLADLQDGPRPEEIAAAEANLQAANSSVAAANATLNQTAAAATDAEITAAQAALAQAQAQETSTRIAYDQATQQG
ncbi:MAG: biotin/lipoyl-binding protein, partial [Anaerolineae bacterium]